MIHRPQEPPLLASLHAALAGIPAPPLSTPWLGWLVVALCRQRARQHWLAEVARSRLNRASSSDGRVPGMEDWSYAFHGRGLCLSGPGNEILDVDFFAEDDDAQTIDPWFFATRVRHLAPKPFVEARVQHWLGTGSEGVMLALADLRRAGVLSHPSSDHVFRLHPALEALHAEVARIDFDNPSVQRDWSERLGESARAVEPREHEGFVAWCVAGLGDRKHARVIGSLAHLLPREVVERECHRLLDGPIDATTGAAIEALSAIGARPDERALTTLRRMDPKRHNPYSACAMARWLFTRGAWPDVALELILSFSRQRTIVGFRGNPFDADYAILALRHAPQAALPLVRVALRSSTPAARTDMAALLSVLDAPWCRDELLAAAGEARDPGARRLLVGFLMYTADRRTRELAQSMMPAAPDLARGGVGYTFQEVEFLNLRGTLEHARERAAEVAAELRPN